MAKAVRLAQNQKIQFRRDWEKPIPEGGNFVRALVMTKFL